MPDLIKRSLEIIGGATLDVGKNYTSNIEALANDAKAIRANLTHTGKDAAETFSKMKSSGIMKKFTDWFFQKNNEYDDFDLSGIDDEFDAGFSMDSGDDEEVPKASVLDIDSMRDITKGQVSAMYSIGGKQVEASIANTAEIVSSINNRSSELIASVNNINTSLISISSKLDKLIELNGIVVQSSVNTSKFNEKNPLTDNGTVTLSNVYNRVRDNAGGGVGTIKDTFEILKMSLTPEALVSNYILQPLAEKKLSVLGGKSVDDIGKSFNDAVGSVTHNVLSELIASPLFRNIVGNTMDADKDYGKLKPNGYNTDRALFDGMTRHSIIHIIPEYLKKINETLSGQSYNIDSKGQLTTSTAANREFDKVARNAFNSSGISDKTKALLTDDLKAYDINIRQYDVDEVGKVLTAVYVSYLHKRGIPTLAPSMVSVNDAEVIQQACETLAYGSKKSYSYWEGIVTRVLYQISLGGIDATNFTSNVNNSLKNMVTAAEKAAISSGPNAKVGKISFSTIQQQYREQQKEKRGIDSVAPSTNDPTGSSVGNSGKGTTQQFTMLDYTRGIFDILNRGINVRVDNWNKKSRYKRYQLSKSTTPSIEDDVFSVIEKDPNIKVGEDGKVKGLFDHIKEHMIPRGLRLSMQHFGLGPNNFGFNPDTPDDNQKQPSDVNGVDKPGENNTEDNSLHKAIIATTKSVIGTVSDKLGITEKLKPHIDDAKKLGDTIIGEKVVGEDGVERRQGGIVQGLANQAKDKVIQTGKYIVEDINYKKTQHDISNWKPENASDENDKIQAQKIFAMMQTAVTDGDAGPDIGAIQKAIGEIKNQKLKTSIQNAVIPMLQRNGQKDTSKSPFGKLLSSALGGLKKVFSPMLSGLKSIFSVIKNVGFKLLGYVGRIAKAFMATQITGLSNIGRGLFGQKAKFENGVQVRPETEGLIKSLFGKQINGVTKVANKLLSGISNVTKNLVTGIKNTLSNVTKNISKGIDDITKKISDKAENSIQNIATQGPNVLTHSKLGFMAGFTDSLNEAAENAKKELMKKPQSYGDKKLDELHAIATNKSKKSVFSELLNVAENILQKIPNNQNKPVVNGTTTPNKTTNNDGTTQPTTAPTQGATSTNTVQSAVVPATGPASGTVTKKAGVAYSLGQIAGGVLAALPLISTIVSLLSSLFPSYNELVSKVLGGVKEILSPLNAFFEKMSELLEPILDPLTEVLSDVMGLISDVLVELADCVFDIITPILEALKPFMDAVMPILDLILDLLTGVIKLAIVPIANVLENLIVPLVRAMSYDIQIISGLIQVGFGNVVSTLGGILSVVGLIGRIFGMKSGPLIEHGSNLYSMGANMSMAGFESIKTGVEGRVSLYQETIDKFMNNGQIEQKPEEKQITVSDRVKEKNHNINGSIMDGVISRQNNADPNVYNTYGSGDQKSYGNYLNMADRGCGPIALSQVYQMRTGGRIDPRSMASMMNGYGTYDPSAGTSVGGFINTGRSLGMNVQAGGVTANSLRYASPNNPITVIGSGQDYGTKPGNNHYMNVIGTNKGMAYVSNPLSGKIERRPVSTLVQSTKLGIYGSGDTEYTGYKFDENITNAMTRLTTVAGSLLKMFTGDTVEESMKASMDKSKEDSINKQSIDGFSDEEIQLYKQEAGEEFEKSYPKYDGESDSSYEARKNAYIQKYLHNKQIERYTSMALSVTNSSANVKYNAETGEWEPNNDFNTSITDASNSVTNGTNNYFMNSGTMIGNTDEEKIWSFLVSAGLTKYAAAGAMGCWEAESLNNPNTLEGYHAFSKSDVNKALENNENLDDYTVNKLFPMYARNNRPINKTVYKGTDGHYYPGFGLAQWTGTRGQNLLNFSKMFGGDWRDLTTQLNFFWNHDNEFRSRENKFGLKTKLDASTSPEDAATIFLDLFENQSSTWHTTKTGKSQNETRRKYARKFYDQYVNYALIDDLDDISEYQRGGIAGFGEAWFYKGAPLTDTNGNYISTNVDLNSISMNRGSVDTDLIARSSALVFEALSRANPELRYDASGGHIMNLETLDGETIDGIRPDCSGMMSAVIRHMGYKLKSGTKSGRTAEWKNHKTNDIIYDQNGRLSSDWIVKDFDPNDRQPGDIIVQDYGGSGHTDIYFFDTSTGGTWKPRGYNAGSGNKGGSIGSGMRDSVQLAKSYLDTGVFDTSIGAKTIRDSGGTTTIRYIGIKDENPYSLGSQTDTLFKDPFTNTSSTLWPDPFVEDTSPKILTNDFGISAQALPTPNRQNVSISNNGGGGNYRSTIGSGDTLYNSIIGSGDTNTNNTTYIPPLNNDMLFNNHPVDSIVPTIINNYEIKKDDSADRERLRQILTNTYNVRAERVEELLERILEKLDGRDKTSPKPSDSTKSPKLFNDDSIPKQVVRLSQ